jgi:hypothetical protein
MVSVLDLRCVGMTDLYGSRDDAKSVDSSRASHESQGTSNDSNYPTNSRENLLSCIELHSGVAHPIPSQDAPSRQENTKTAAFCVLPGIPLASSSYMGDETVDENKAFWRLVKLRRLGGSMNVDRVRSQERVFL